MLLVSICQHLMSARLLVPPRCYLRLEKAILECFGDTIAPLQLLLYSLRVVLVVIIGKKKVLTSCGTPFTVHFATTFTILGFRKRNLFIIFYYVHYAMVMSKKQNLISALPSRRQDHEKNVYIRFHKKCINCYYVHYDAIMTRK